VPVDAATLGPVAVPYLERQSWFQASLPADEGSGADGTPTVVLDCTRLSEGPPGLASVLFGRGRGRFHLFVGWREVAALPDALGGDEHAVLGVLEDGGVPVLVYDALCDPELALGLLERVAKGRERARSVRSVRSLVSHASLVFDERLFMKCYRVLEPAPRPEVEVLLQLDAVGFNHVLAPVAHFERSGFDLVLVREFEPSALEGRSLAVTSLRDLLATARADDPASAEERAAASGGDLSAEMRRLGEMTARLHLALAVAFGERELPGGGVLIRVHGDYHLRRVMRTDIGWIVAGFGDDPSEAATPGADGRVGRREATPLEDLADMCYSLREVARSLAESWRAGPAERVAALVQAWSARNEAAFLDGYLSDPAVRRLLPPGAPVPAVADLVAARERRRGASSPGPRAR
jgi:hypothetical protein